MAKTLKQYNIGPKVDARICMVSSPIRVRAYKQENDTMESTRSIKEARKGKYMVGEYAEVVHVADRKTPVSQIKEIFGEDEPISAIVIVSEKKPIGLVMNIHLDRILSQRYGVALFYHKPIEVIMDVSPLVVEYSTPIEEAAVSAMNRDKAKLFDHLVITKKGEVSGIVSVQNILNAILNIRRKNAHEMNRINEELHQQIEERRKAEEELVKLNHELEDRVLLRTVEIRDSNQKLIKAVEDAQAANRAKSDFLANMSHELRTPLNHIIGFTELVLEQYFGQLNGTQAEYLSDVLSSSNHLLSLINDILDLSKVEAGKLELYNSEIDLQKMLENSIVMIKEKAQKHRIRLSTGFDDIPETIEGDTRKLKQILYNLLSNAVKFTPDGGSICLRADRYSTDSFSMPHGFQPTLNSERGDYLKISVKDNGIGLKEEDLQRIFDPFEQAYGQRNRKYQGTGLGLSLTKKFVELHHGWIWAESQGEGKGSHFCFVIPSRQSEDRNTEQELIGAQNLKGIR
jgi:signal transduction histidine kinase